MDMMSAGTAGAVAIHTNYTVAAAMLVVSLVVGAVALGAGRWLSPKRRSTQDNPPPEYGGGNGHKTWVQLRLRYAVVALLFIAFDMEMVFMFPWAVAFRSMGLTALIDMFVFIAILASAIAFAWKAGAFDWER